MTQQPGMSILVPAWRAAPFIQGLVTAFAKQENLKGIPIEVIIGVDGCADTLREVKAVRMPESFRALWFPRNSGCYVTMNSMVPRARHQYLMFFGADDLPLPCMTDEFAVNRQRADIVRQRCHQDKVAVGAFGIWREAWHRMGGFQPWRCQADSEFLRRARRMQLTLADVPVVTFIRGRHANQLTRLPDTGIGSPLRENYRALEKGELSHLAHIEPVTAEYEEVTLCR